MNARALAAAPRPIFALLCAALFAAAPALADGDARTDDVPRLVPYQGTFEVDGRPLDARGADALHILFALYDGPDAEQPTYRQAIVVEVFSGRFNATIGPTGVGPDDAERAIGDVISAADDLYLGMTLLGDPDDPDDDIALANRQRIHAAPYALWTTAATDLSAARDLRVGGAAEVVGDLTVGGAVTLPEGALTGREIADGSLALADLTPAVVGAGLRAAGGAVALDRGALDARIRTWVRGHCRLQLGWRNRCSNCALAPAKDVTVQANGQCIAGRGADTGCRDNNRWGGVNIDGEASNDDVFYVRMVCD